MANMRVKRLTTLEPAALFGAGVVVVEFEPLEPVSVPDVEPPDVEPPDVEPPDEVVSVLPVPVLVEVGGFVVPDGVPDGAVALPPAPAAPWSMITPLIPAWQ